MAESGGALCDHPRQPSIIQPSFTSSELTRPNFCPSNSVDLCSSQDSSGIGLTTEDHSDNIHSTPSILSLNATEPSLFSSVYESHTSEEPWADIELISLLHKQNPRIPRYRLRVDPCTAFLGYKHKDFSGAKRATRRSRGDTLVSGSLTELSIEGDAEGDSESSDSDDETSSLTSEQIRHTLDYFLLCGLRVSQMAHTYEDLEAITHLLEEKQNDLELAAKIGKNLLDKNHELERRLTDTEKKLTASEDTVSQLRHNLSIKDNLLQIYTRDHGDGMIGDETSLSPGWLTPTNGAGSNSDKGWTADLSVSAINFAHLNKKIRELEEENFVLREERNRLNATADQLDEQETALIRDCARQLVSANMHIRTLSDELAKKSDAYLNQQSEVTRLLTRGLDLENRVKQLASENEMLVNRLQESQGSQQRLSNELTSLRDKYDECLSLYTEARSEIRALRKRSRRAHLRSGYLSSPGTIFSPPPHFPNWTDSNTVSCTTHGQCSDGGSSSSLDVTANNTLNDILATETSLASDLARTAARDCATSNVDRLFRVMDQARTARETSDGEPRENPVQRPEFVHDDTVSSSGFVSGSEPSELLPRPSEYQTGETPLSPLRDKRPLSPINLLAWSKSDIFEDRLKRHSWLGCDFNKSFLSEGPSDSPRTIDDTVLTPSVLSSDPTVVYGQSFFRMPQRLQLIKPLDGSEVLQHWQRLATPSFTNALFEAPLPGVRSRAGVNSEAHPLESGGLNGSTPSICRLAGCTSPDPSLTAKNEFRGSRHASSRELVHRFGLSSPTQLLGTSLRSRSVEHVQHLVRTSDQSSKKLRPPRPSSIVSSEQINHSSSTSPFSLTSLVSSLLPFSLASISSSANPESKAVTHEPIRIRPRSPPGSRGLLDVTGNVSTPPTLQRAASQGSSCTPLHLPTPPPPPQIATQGVNRTPFCRTVRNPSLTGITEESGSPPKLDETLELPTTDPFPSLTRTDVRKSET